MGTIWHAFNTYVVLYDGSNVMIKCSSEPDKFYDIFFIIYIS